MPDLVRGGSRAGKPAYVNLQLAPLRAGLFFPLPPFSSQRCPAAPVRPPVAARPCIPRARLLLFAPIPLSLLISGRQSHPEQYPSVRNPSKTAVLQCRRARNMRRARVRITGMGPQGQVGRHPCPTMSHPLVGNANALRDIGPVSRSPRWPNLARHFPAGRALVSD